MRTLRVAALTAAVLFGWAALPGQEVAAQGQREGSPTGSALPGKSPETPAAAAGQGQGAQPGAASAAASPRAPDAPAAQGPFLEPGEGQGLTLVGGRSGAGPSSIQPGASPVAAGVAGGTGVGTETPGSTAVAPAGDAGAKK
jgi:hypothetical protein